MAQDRYDALIVGAGHAGAQAAIALRQQGFAGSIGLLGAEPDPPYERPPLSKDYLAGAKAFERILIRPATFWGERDVELILGEPVTAVDPDGHEVALGGGRTIGYRQLIWAAGGAPRRLACAGGDLAGVHTIRTRTDVDRLIAELPTAERVAIVGGGYIGLEAAAVLRKFGKQVTLLEALDRVLARVAGAPLSAFFEAEHCAQGVDVRTGITVDSILGENGTVRGVRLGDGAVVPTDLVIVGIGIVPAVAPLAAAGAACGDGVEVDALCRTGLPDVFAIGDCAAHLNRFAGGVRVRIESVQNANDQASAVARTLCGAPTPYDAVPWFWSNQYDLKLQTVGLSIGHDAVEVVGDPASRSFSVAYHRVGRLVALDCVNAVKAYVQGRKRILEEAS